MRKLLFLIAYISLCFGCKKDNDTAKINLPLVQKSVSGKFSFSLTSNLKSAKEVAFIASDDSINFFLDTLKSSRTFYFSLTNTGQNDITNVSLSTDDTSFVISPPNIKTLYGNKSPNIASLNQLVSLDIIHGTRINGIGFSGLLKKENNYCNINIQGQTNNGKSDTIIRLKVKIKVFAKLMDISLFQEDQEINLFETPGKILGGGPFNIAMNQYFYNNKPILIKNTGNVAINMIMKSGDTNYPVIQSKTLNPSDTLTLKLETKPTKWGDPYEEIQLNSNGTIFNQQKLCVGDDGKAYFAMVYNRTTIIPIVPKDSLKK